MHRLATLLVFLSLLAAGIAPVMPVQANQLQSIDAEQTAEIDFPESITFRLTATTPHPVDQAELRYTTSGKPYSNAAVVHFTPTTGVVTEYTVDAQVDYIEPGVDITYQWVLGNAGVPVAQTAEQTLTWIDESLDWTRTDSADVSVFSYDNDPAFDQYILQVAQESADRFKTAYGVAEIAPMRIWVYASGRDFASTLRQNSESWIGGFSIPEAGVIAVPIEDGDEYSVRRVISHEVSHHVLYQATKNPFSFPPVWLDEGLAVEGQLAGNESDLEIALGGLEEGTLPTLRTLSSSFPTDPAAANRSYATSHMAVEFIIERWGWEGMQNIIREFQASATQDEALQAALGLDTEDLDATFRQWLTDQTT